MHTAVTHGIRVEVQSQHDPRQSSVADERYVFIYTIEIKNESDTTVQLRARHWHILHGSGKQEEVKGPGVVGEQPVLRPGEAYRYSSGCVLSTPHGSMHGTYQMVRENGEPLEVEIPAFALAVPGSLN